MKREVMTAEQALKEGMQLPFALIRTWEQVCLGPTPAQSPAPETLLEARFFDGDREIRLFRPEEALCAVSLTCARTRSRLSCEMVRVVPSISANAATAL